MLPIGSAYARKIAWMMEVSHRRFQLTADLTPSDVHSSIVLNRRNFRTDDLITTEPALADNGSDFARIREKRLLLRA